jgi:imidazolonepropionase-like amidohydrolase
MAPHPDSFAGRGVRRLGCAVLFAAGLAASSIVFAQAPDAPKTPEKQEGRTAEPEEDKKEKKKEEKDKYFAVVGGIIHTITNGEVYNGTVLAKNGKIVRIGRFMDLPAETEVLEVGGLHVYPGFVAAAAGNMLGAEPPDDTTDVYALYLTMGLAGGITTAMSGNTAAKLTYGTADDIIVKRDVFETLRYSSSDPANRRSVREKLEKVRQYARELAAHQERKKTDPAAKEPEKDWLKGDYEDYLKLLRQEAVAEVTARSAHELLEVADLAQQFDLRVVVRGAVEGWTVAPQLARAGISAIITPRDQAAENDELNRANGSSIENAAILHQHGIPLAIVPRTTSITLWGIAGQDVLQLNMEAAFAVRGGMSNDSALRAITIDAARVLGIDDRVGSLEVGKDADMIVVDGDPLHYMTMVRFAVVNGRKVYDKQADTLYSHIRPDGTSDSTAPADYWPRRLGAEQPQGNRATGPVQP